MSNSKLVNYTKISPNSTNPRNHKIDTITIHHMAGKLSVEACGAVFAEPSRGASSNYGIDSNGRVGLYVDEKNRSWCTSSRENDHRAVTIEVANSSTGGEWPVSDKAYAKLIDLCVDICQRNGIKKLNYTGDKTGNLTMHKWFANTQCPGPYLEKRFPDIAAKVNAKLGAEGTSEAPVECKPVANNYALPELSYGSKGDWVKILQALLTYRGYDCGKHGVDGDFGGATREAVKKFQRENGLAKEADGIVGPKTWNKLLGIK
jgi:N-acetyl-anhydromuramyl-L-alanine amidase AmpD